MKTVFDEGLLPEPCSCQSCKNKNSFSANFEKASLLDEILSSNLELNHKNKIDDVNHYNQEIVLQDDRKKISDTTIFPFRFICNIEIDDCSIGTGTLIGPRTLLTAGHLVAGKSFSKIKIIPGRNGTDTPPFGHTIVADVKFSDQGYKSKTKDDFAIVYLKDKIGEKVGFWSYDYHKSKNDDLGHSILQSGKLPLSPKSKKLKINLCGYPGDKPDNPIYNCTTRNGRNKLCNVVDKCPPDVSPICGTFQYFSFDTLIDLREGMLAYYNDTCMGHSGSPIWMKRSEWTGGRVLIGIHVVASSSSNSGVFLDDDISKFIKQNIK